MYFLVVEGGVFAVVVPGREQDCRVLGNVVACFGWPGWQICPERWVLVRRDLDRVRGDDQRTACEWPGAAEISLEYREHEVEKLHDSRCEG